jgi:hypothetical protein
MALYEYFLVFFIATNLCLFFWQNGRSVRSQGLDDKSSASVIAGTAAKWQFKKRFLPVYLLVFGADWLQVWIVESAKVSF